MTLEEIEAIFWGDQREQPTRVRLARVIRALRDEVTDIKHVQKTIAGIFDDILGSEHS